MYTSTEALRPTDRPRRWCAGLDLIGAQAGDPDGFRAIISSPAALAALGFAVIPLGENGHALITSFFSAARDPQSAAALFAEHDWKGIGIVDLSIQGEAAVWPLIELSRLTAEDPRYGCDGSIAADLQYLAATGAHRHRFARLH